MWPVTPCPSSDLLEGDLDSKQEKPEKQFNTKKVSTVFVNSVDTQENICKDPIEKLMEYYSSFYRLKKAICWLLRVWKCLKGDKPNQGCLTVAEMNYVEKLIIKFAQSQVYSEEISALKQGKNVFNSSPIKKLSPALKDGILVVNIL